VGGGSHRKRGGGGVSVDSSEDRRPLVLRGGQMRVAKDEGAVGAFEQKGGVVHEKGEKGGTD
jgi:hypothetical protein